MDSLLGSIMLNLVAVKVSMQVVASCSNSQQSQGVTYGAEEHPGAHIGLPNSAENAENGQADEAQGPGR